MSESKQGRACILVSCQDRPGIVAAVSTHLFEHGANIVELDQHTSAPDGAYFMRVEFEATHVAVTEISKSFAAVAARFEMNWRMESSDRRQRVAVFVSKEDHCLMELLWQWRWGELPVEIAAVVSNHTLLQDAVASFGLPFHHIPVEPQSKREAEARAVDLLKGKVDLIVLARYMQILTGDFIAQFPNQIINIHHSFLPAFIGSRPYDQAFERGVKIIGATAHYVTEELDAGPIIEQDIARVNHRDTVADMKSVGRTIEKTVLARAVRWHVEDRVLVHGNKTVVFNGC